MASETAAPPRAPGQAAAGRVDGIFRREGEARAVPAVLTVADGIAHVSEPSGRLLARAAFAALDVSDRVGNIDRSLAFAAAGVFETPDNDAIDRLCRAAGRRFAGAAAELERFRPRLIAFAALAIVLCLAIYRFAVPLLVEIAVAATPPVVPEAMGRAALASLDQAVFGESKLPPERQQALREGFAGLARLAPREGVAPGAEPYRLNFRDGGLIGPNAIALPDGSIILTDQLVDLVGDDDELIFGVLGHEIGHVARKHSLRQLYRAFGITALIMLIGGDIGAATEDVLLQGSAILQLGFSREAESDADRYSVELLHEAGHDPAAVVRFFEILREKLDHRGTNDFLASHPATAKRIEATRKLAEEIKAR